MTKSAQARLTSSCVRTSIDNALKTMTPVDVEQACINPEDREKTDEVEGEEGQGGSNDDVDN